MQQTGKRALTQLMRLAYTHALHIATQHIAAFHKNPPRKTGQKETNSTDRLPAPARNELQPALPATFGWSE